MMEKENVLNIIEDDIDRRNRNWNKVDAHLAENAIDAHGFTPFASVMNNANQSIPSTTWTSLAFNSEIEDTDSIHDNTVNNSRLTCKTAGWYLVIGAAAFTNITSGFVSLRVRLNGTTLIGSSSLNAVIDGALDVQYVNFMYLNTNDYIELQAYHNKGGTTNSISASNQVPKFSMVKVG